MGEPGSDWATLARARSCSGRRQGAALGHRRCQEAVRHQRLPEEDPAAAWRREDRRVREVDQRPVPRGHCGILLTELPHRAVEEAGKCVIIVTAHNQHWVIRDRRVYIIVRRRSAKNKHGDEATLSRIAEFLCTIATSRPVTRSVLSCAVSWRCPMSHHA